jgi:DNA-binding transcriptional LysR family regulator
VGLGGQGKRVRLADIDLDEALGDDVEQLGAAQHILIRLISAGRLVGLLPDYALPSRPMHILYAPDRRMTPNLRTFIDFTLEKFGPTRDTEDRGQECPERITPGTKG